MRYLSIALAVLLLLIGIFIGWRAQQPFEVHKTHEVSEPAKRDNKANKQERGSQQNPVIVEVLPSIKSKAETAREEYEQYEKPITERYITWSTIALAVFTLVLAIFTGFLWTSTYQLVSDARRTSRHQLRAYVGIDDLYYQYDHVPNAPYNRSRIYVPPDENIRLRPRLRVINYGETPAKDLVIRSWSTLALIDEEFELLYRDENHAVPHQTLDPTQPFGTSIPVSVTLEEFDPREPARSDKKLLFVYGSIIYGDIENQWWVRHFCYYYDPVPSQERGRLNRFIPHRRYNHEEPSEYKSSDLTQQKMLRFI